MENSNGHQEEERRRSGDGSDEEQEALSRAPQGNSERSGEEKMGGQGCIYFIETSDGAFVKIGYSTNIPKRLDQIGVLLPGLRLIGHMPGTFQTESWLHAKFAALRERGEWFRHSEELRQFIAIMGLIQTAQEPRGPRVRKIKEPRALTVEETPVPELVEMTAQEKNPAAVALGRRGGKKSAAGRMAKMTAEERSAIARKAAAASAKVRSAKAKKKAAK